MVLFWWGRAANELQPHSCVDFTDGSLDTSCNCVTVKEIGFRV